MIIFLVYKMRHLLFSLITCTILLSCGSQEKKPLIYSYPFPPETIIQPLKAFPFEKELKKVLLVSYDFPREGFEVKDTTINLEIVENGKIAFNRFSEKIYLSNAKIDSLKNILFELKSDDEQIGADCYWPRHCVYFLNEKDSVLGYLEFCFECSGAISSPNNLSQLCNGKFEIIENFMSNCGIKNNVKDNKLLPKFD